MLLFVFLLAGQVDFFEDKIIALLAIRLRHFWIKDFVCCAERSLTKPRLLCLVAESFFTLEDALYHAIRDSSYLTFLQGSVEYFILTGARARCERASPKTLFELALSSLVVTKHFYL